MYYNHMICWVGHMTYPASPFQLILHRPLLNTLAEVDIKKE